ncbi:MAG: DUF2321 domain-containing protein [Terriglobales bacterium]
MGDFKSTFNPRTGERAYEGYDTARICENGHVITRYANTGGKVEKFCSKCGAKTITTCPQCEHAIRGHHHPDMPGATEQPAPKFCHNCGNPYPWMADRLQTAKELLYHDDKLSLEDREKLWDLLQYVMSNPKSDLVPAKKKLIDIRLGKAAAPMREAVLDLLAKYFAEMSKP